MANRPGPPGENEVRGLLERARGGDPTDLAALHQALDRHPEIWRAYGDLAGHARATWIDLIAGVDLALKESLGRRVESMKTELAGPEPSPLEVLLIERVAACWLQIGYADAAAARAGGMSIPQGNYLRKQLESAHRRYLSALGALAMAKRLLGLATGEVSGTASKPSLVRTDPTGLDGADPTTGGRVEGEIADGEAGRVDDHGDVLEFGPQRPDGPGGGRRGSRRGVRGSSRP